MPKINIEYPYDHRVLGLIIVLLRFFFYPVDLLSNLALFYLCCQKTFDVTDPMNQSNAIKCENRLHSYP
jgi:hypothetical protein